jgi:hypothetical protein
MVKPLSYAPEFGKAVVAMLVSEGVDDPRGGRPTQRPVRHAHRRDPQGRRQARGTLGAEGFAQDPRGRGDRAC